MSTHEDFNRKIEIRSSSDRSFGFVFVIFFAIVGLWPLRASRPVRVWALAVSAAFLVIALICPNLLRPLNQAWTRLGLLLSKIVNPLVTGILFYLVFTPLGILFRILGKDPLRLHFDRQAPTYWIERRPPGPAPETMPHQF